MPSTASSANSALLQKLGLYWERNAIEHDRSLNANVVLPRVVSE